MHFHRGKQPVLVSGPLWVHLVVGDDLVLCFLQLDQLAELVGLARFPFADDLRVWFEQTKQFVGKLGQPREHPCLGLPYHSAHLIGHGFQPFDQPVYTPSAAERAELRPLATPAANR